MSNIISASVRSLWYLPRSVTIRVSPVTFKPIGAHTLSFYSIFTTVSPFWYVVSLPLSYLSKYALRIQLVRDERRLEEMRISSAIFDLELILK